jgi:hypothetical protein
MIHDKQMKTQECSRHEAEALLRFISDLSVLLTRHLDVVVSTLSQASAHVIAESESILHKSRGMVERGEIIQCRDKQTTEHESGVEKESEGGVGDVKAFSWCVKEIMSSNIKGLKSLDDSAERFVSSLKLMKTMDDISLRRLVKVRHSLIIMNECILDLMVHYRQHGQLADDMVDGIKIRILASFSDRAAANEDGCLVRPAV